MRTFAERSKATRRDTASSSTLPHRSQIGSDHEVNPVKSAEHVKGTSTIPGGSRFSHDFSRIRVHGPAPRTNQAPQTGKLDGPLPEDGPWPEITGRTETGMDLSGAGATTFTPAPAPGVFPPSPPVPSSPPVATPSASPKLSKKTVSGPTARNCGGFKWVVQWELDKKTTKGGWIVQKVELPYDVKDCSDKAVDPATAGGLQPSWYPVWEAWPVNKDQKVTTYAEGGDVEDDTYGSGSLPDTKGTVTVKGTAEYYDGLTLPSSFKVTNKAPTWILPATTSAPTLAGGTGAISHNLKATWNCCGGNTTATRVETT